MVREACLVIVMCHKYASCDADFIHCISPDLSFSFFLLDELWKLSFNFIFVDTDTHICCITHMLGSFLKSLWFILCTVLIAHLLVWWGRSLFRWQ